MTDLPNFTVRVSRRAKNVVLKFTPQGQLEVVVPPGFDAALVPGVLNRKRTWIEKSKRRLDERREILANQPILPHKIELRAVDQVWQVAYQAKRSDRITVREKADNNLSLSGAVKDENLCRLALRTWLNRKAKQHLPLWLHEIGHREALSYRKVIIRGQKTRWGSCSSRGTISLNRNLLFLPERLVHYVFIHELCHTRHMNHSPQFWALVSSKVPDYKALRRELRIAWRYLPRWIQNEGEDEMAGGA
jgi:predicted metal-dependent hydrolase